VKQQPKWRIKSGDGYTTHLWVSSSEPTTEEEMSHPMGRDGAKVAMWKAKGKRKAS
jgi:hypothetical protein